jgi:hypothetical protein
MGRGSPLIVIVARAGTAPRAITRREGVSTDPGDVIGGSADGTTDGSRIRTAGVDDRHSELLREEPVKESRVMERSLGRRILDASLLSLGLSQLACAHNREVIYPGGGDGLVSVRTARGMHVRAPFVNIHVQGQDTDTLSPQDD